MRGSERLERLLFLVPYVAHRGGVPLRELAGTLGVSTAQIEADLDLLSLVGRPPLTPDHLIDIYVEDDTVYVDLDQSLSRPLRLTHDEAAALVLGAKLVGHLGGVGEELERVLAKILAQLNPAERDRVQSLAKGIAVCDSVAESRGPVLDLRAALEGRREVEMEYYSASSDRQKAYRLQPLAMLAHSGIEYLVALDVGAELQEKLFRLDRVGAVRITDTPFSPPAELDLERFRTQRLYFGHSELTAQVRFHKQLAEPVSERFPDSQITVEKSGAVRVLLTTSSSAWLARWVLAFGTQAEVLSPEEQRGYLARFCAEAAEAYGAKREARSR